MNASTRTAAVLTIDLDAIAANWKQLAQRTSVQGCAAVVKADAYGLGAAKVAPVLYEEGCRRFFVALLEEGVALRPSLPADATIFVLHGPLPGTERTFVEHGLVPVLNTLEQIALYRTLSSQLSRRLPCVVQFDTGMARLGLQSSELISLLHAGAALQGLDVQMVMTHLVAAEEPDNPLNALQLQRFVAMKGLMPPCLGSLANSSGIFLGEGYHFDVARPGAALYGVAPTVGAVNPMCPVVRLDARLIQVRDIPAGVGVGYNHTWISPESARIATFGVGYADGYLRSLSNSATLRIGGHQVKLVGRVSMDTITVDVSGVPLDALQLGTLVQVIDEVQDINVLAKQAGTNAYEILTQLGARYERHYLRGGQRIS